LGEISSDGKSLGGKEISFIPKQEGRRRKKKKVVPPGRKGLHIRPRGFLGPIAGYARRKREGESQQ